MNPEILMPPYYKLQIQLKKETNQIILGTTLEALLRTKSKYIHLRKIKVQNGNKLTYGSL